MLEEGSEKKNRFIYVSYIFTSISIIPVCTPPSEKGPVAQPGGSLVLVWLTPSTAGPPPARSLHTQPGGPVQN